MVKYANDVFLLAQMKKIINYALIYIFRNIIYFKLNNIF
jgi:hypothetical protein